MRHPTPSAQSQTPDQFLEILKDADRIQVAEISPLNSSLSLETALKEFEKDGPGKAFLVSVRPRRIAEPATAEPANEPGGITQDYLVKNAELLIAGGEYVLARNIYSYLLKENIKNGTALKGLGVCLYRLGQIAAARKCFKALWEIHQRPDAHVWLGMCHVHEKQDALAIQYFKKIQNPAELSPNEAFEFFREMGNSQTRCGEYAEAAANYKQALALRPLSDNLYVNLGTLEIQRNRLTAAIDHFRQAIEINPRNSKAYCGLGLVALDQGDRATAETSLYHALDLDSQNAVALIQLVTLATGAKNPHEPRLKERLEKFLELEPKNTEVRFAYAVWLFKSGRWTSCEKEIDQLLRIEPAHFKAKQLKEELHNQKHQQL